MHIQVKNVKISAKRAHPGNHPCTGSVAEDVDTPCPLDRHVADTSAALMSRQFFVDCQPTSIYTHWRI